MKVLVAKCCKTKVVFAHCVRQKGADQEGFAVECLRRDLQWLGHTRVVLKSDNESAIVKPLRETFKELRITASDDAPAVTGEAISLEQCAEEHPPPYDSSANGSIESACRDAQAHLRTHKPCLEQRLQKTNPSRTPNICMAC